MRDGTRTWRVWAAVFALMWCAAPALAQVPANVVIVGANVTTDPDVFTNDLQDGIQEAIRLSRSGTGHITILVQDDASPYGPVSIPADADIELFGVHVGVNADLRNPSLIVVQGVAGDAAITIHTDSSPNFLIGNNNESAFLGGAVDVLAMHHLSATGGNNGILVDASGTASTGDTVAVLFDSLYIHENAGTIGGEGNGIRSEGPTDLTVVNCSIWGNGDRAAGGDEGAGISIGVGGGLFALHDTILLNENYGIHFEDNGIATIRNTIVYRNGDEDEQSAVAGHKDGGIVWDMDPFIDPNFGPVAGGIPVTLFGDFVGTSSFTAFNVHFGPPDLAPPVAVSGGAPDLTVTLPPAYRGVPGPVDVYVIRIGDGYQTRIPIAFTYVNDAGGVPLVSQVVPEWGDTVGGNFVFVLGAGFEPDCDVFFAAQMSDKVTYLSSGELLVKVPEAAGAGKVEVLVVNNRTGGTSVATPPDDYEYRATGDTRPSIVHISPNYFRDVEGDEAPVPRITSNILVWNLGGTPVDPVVKIGGLVVPYASVLFIGGPFAPQPNLDSDGGFLYEIIDVEIPVSQFGAGGSYDVTVINPSGLSDTLNAGFTYYADGIPRPDPSDREWLPANFATLATVSPRTFQGTAFDTDILLTLNPAGVPIVLGPFNPMDGAALPPFVSHTQREVEFSWPGDPTTVTDGIIMLPAGAQTVVVQIDNSADAQGDPSVGATVLTTDFHYLATSFDLQNIQVTVGTPDTITATISNVIPFGGVPGFNIFVDDVDVGVITNNGSGSVTFTVPAAQPGIYGPVDIRVETTTNPVGTDPLYYIAENAYSYRRSGSSPQAYGVYPRTIVEDTTVQPSPVRVNGADFIGPFSTTTPYTRIFLDDGDGVPELGTQDLDVSFGAVLYEINSFMELRFTIDIVAAEANQTVTIPRNIPIAIHLDNFDPVLGTSLTTPTTLTAAVIISAADPPPEITEVVAGAGPRRDGPVRGGTAVAISGFNFDTLAMSGLDPIVRIGGEQAEVVGFTDNPDPTPDVLLIVTPPAPDLLPGTYKVVVIRPADQQQGISPPDKDFTYFLDGAPQILEIVPNYVPFPAVGDTDPRYITITGLNFMDIVQVVFDFGGPNEQTVDHYSVTPTEIVVKVPLGNDANSVLPLTPGGEVSIPIFVRNVPNDATTIIGTTNESNSENIFIFDDDRGIEPNVVTLEFNNVFLNSNDYVMVQPGTGSISIDPMFDPRDPSASPGLPGPKLVAAFQDPWVGKLAIRDPDDGITGDNKDFENPMRNKGGEFDLFPITDLDFELETRPDFQGNPLDAQGTGPASGLLLPDIGADEIVNPAVTGGNEGWYLARPIPNPVPALDEGDLSFLLAFRPVDLVLDPFDIAANSGLLGPTVNDVSFFIVPQGGDPTLDADKIRLTTIRALGGGRFLVANVNQPIETVLVDFGDVGPSIQVPNDLIADGHAAIYVRPDPAAPLFILGDDPFDLSDFITSVNPNTDSSGSTFDQAIIEQAVLGRHFLIDTQAPRVNLNSVLLTTTGAIESHEIVPPLGFNDIFGLPPLSAVHPTVPTGALLAYFPWYPSVVLAPLDTNQTAAPGPTPATDFGLVLPSNTGPASTSIFFNPVSDANLTGGVDLQFRVAIEFVDIPLVDSSGTLITGIDFYTGTDDPRQVSGFEPSFSTTAVDGDANTLTGPVHWDTIRGATLLRDTVALPVQISNDFATSGANLGVFNLALSPELAMSNPPNNGTDSDNVTVVASWGGPADATTDPMVFADLTDHLDAALRGAFNLSIQFDGVDLAGNSSSDDLTNTLLNPVNIYWYRDVNSRISGISEGSISSNPLPTYSLIRDGDPSPAPGGGPIPVYSYRIYSSADYRGIYSAVFPAWTLWTADETITSFSALLPADSWILLVVHSADEAGNVEPWDLGVSDAGPLDLTDPAGDAVHQFALNQPNWVRFFFSGTAPPETRVRANFWHDNKANNPGIFQESTVLAAGTDLSLGNLTIVPMPGNETVTNQRVAGEFFISVDVPPEYSPGTDTVEVSWELFRDGVLVLDSFGFFIGTAEGFPAAHGQSDADGFLQIGAAESIRVVIPQDGPGLGDPNLKEDITYVFRSTSRIRRGTLPADLVDASPASVLFTVVPLDTQTFVAQALDPDRQPIVILEEQ